MSGTILQKIDSIDVEDLYLVEQDLNYREKVSIGFLLFADKKPNAHFILQKLLILNATPNASSDILTSYTQINKNWKPFLVEALAIIRANRVLRKLGLRHSEVRTHFLPHIPEMCLYINPILKVLYAMCEMLTSIQAGKLVLEVRDTLDTRDHLRFYNFEYLEVFLLDWITKQVLDASRSETTDIALLIDYFKLNEMNNIKEILSYPLRVINLETNDSGQTESGKIETNFVSDNSFVESEKTTEARHQMGPPSQVRSNDCYDVKRESAGFVLIINQRDFHRSTEPELQSLLPKNHLQIRLGTDIDKNALEKTFASFGYKPVTRNNLNHIEMLRNIREIVKRSIIYDSIVVCILSHGLKGSVYGCDSVPIQIDEIEKILTHDSLIRKPKLLIIQACQGANLQKAREEGRLEHDSGDTIAVDYRDIVKAMSTVPGFASLRHTRQGSWFIQTICKKIDELGDREHLLDILTEVNAAISEKRGLDNECMTSISSQTLRKKFRLPSRLSV